jgi:hypothetical protein
MKLIKSIPLERRKELIAWTFQYFKDVTSEYYFHAILEQESNWDISAMLVDENNNIKGVYLLGDSQLSSLVEDEKYINLKGVEGVVLAVSEEIRGQGWGNKLKDFPKILEIDYIWGQQLKSLNNLEDWLKRRELVAETQSVYITAEIF